MKSRTLLEVMSELDEIIIKYTAEELQEIRIFADSASQLLLIDGEGKNYTIKLTDKEAQ